MLVLWLHFDLTPRLLCAARCQCGMRCPCTWLCVATNMQAWHVPQGRTHSHSAHQRSVCAAPQVVNFSEDIRSQLYKIASISLCSNLGGQIIMSLVMSPPKVRSL